MSQTFAQPEIELGNGAGTGRWMVVIYNNDHNSFDQVIDALMRATGCDDQEAGIEAWEAHTYGKAPVHFASKEVCEAAAEVIESVGIKTDVCPEWDD